MVLPTAVLVLIQYWILAIHCSSVVMPLSALEIILLLYIKIYTLAINPLNNNLTRQQLMVYFGILIIITII